MKLTPFLAMFLAALPSVSLFAGGNGTNGHAATVAAQGTEAQARLFAAARDGNLNELRAALAQGAAASERDDRGNTALILAAYYGHAPLVDALLLAGADPNAGDGVRGNTALMGAIFKGDEATAKRIIDAPGADVNAKNKAGQTAAMFAALFGRSAILDALSARGADLDAMDAGGYTAENLALQQGNQVLAQRIAELRAGAAPASAETPSAK